MEDNRIIDLYWAREEQALTETERKYGGYCRTIARNILKIHEDAEECVSDTWLNAWNAMPPKRPSVLSAFLGKITRNLAFDRWKAAHAEKRGGGSLPLVLDELDECIASAYSLEREVENRELAAALNRFLAQLPETERALFVSRYWFLAPVRELSKKFGFSESKTASMLHRTRGRLRRFLIEEGLA